MIKNKNKYHSMQSLLFDIIIYLFLIFILLITILPILHVLAVSLSSNTAYLQGKVSILPVEFTYKSYEIVFKAGTVPNGFKNSVIYTGLGTAINIILTIFLAYPLSKRKLPLRNFYTTLVVITMFFGGGLIPSFILVTKLKFYNTVWALVLPGAVSAYNMIIMRTFFIGIPAEIEESAKIDGANDFRILFKIVLPLSTAAIATVSLFYLVGHWNSWFNALIYLSSSKKYPLQLILRSIVMEGQMARELSAQQDLSALDYQMGLISVEGIKYATLFVSIAPMIVIYPFIQKYFVKGIMIGSLKG